jgi:hypothetical protein
VPDSPIPVQFLSPHGPSSPPLGPFLLATRRFKTGHCQRNDSGPGGLDLSAPAMSGAETPTRCITPATVGYSKLDRPQRTSVLGLFLWLGGSQTHIGIVSESPPGTSEVRPQLLPPSWGRFFALRKRNGGMLVGEGAVLWRKRHLGRNNSRVSSLDLLPWVQEPRLA